MEENRTYRIRTKIGDDADKVINVKLDQHYDSFEILSLKINQSNNYKFYESDYGVVVGRVLANGGFGIPNAKVSIFIESDDNDDMETRIMYPYKSVNAKNQDGVRYNLLTDFLDKACYQNVGTFPNKRYVLDNNDVIDVFDKYYRYTTVTNNAGDYMIFGVPTGSQRLHVDIDLSDIGMLSQRPRDMIYKGYNINQFESPNKFKQDTNLNSLAQIISQDLGLYVYPYWGDTSETDDNIAVTRADINVDYKFEPTCVFMGSIITDTGSNAIGKNCTSTEKIGKMSELIAGEGSIEMIRKTIDGKVEEFQVKGNRVIDGDGVWCYQIPMNLDYIMTDEFGNIVPSDNPEKGIPTRTRVRFRISVDDAPDDNTARKRCRYLVPNNPRLDEELYPNFTKTKEVDYEFGTRTRDENYRDLLWNKVYTVKNYVPRLQKNRKITDRKHTGIKLINHHEANNPMPYNNVDIKLGFTYRLLCVIFKIFINLVQFLNQIFTALSLGFCAIYKVFDFIAGLFKWPVKFLGWPFRQLANFFKALIVPCVAISSEMCSGNTTHNNTFYPGCGNLMFSGAGAGKLADCIRQKTTESHVKKENKKIKDGEMDESERTTALLGGTEELYNCVETALAEDNDTVSLNFQNDWVNGTLYAPMWFRKITKKRTYLFGLIKRSAKDQWCEGEKDYTRKILRVFNPCSPVRKNKSNYNNFSDKQVTPKYMDYSDDKKRYKDSCGDKCHEKTKAINLDKGLIVKRQTMLGQDVYYYKPVEYSSPLTSLIDKVEDFAVGEEGDGKSGSVKLLFATDIVLLGSLNDCDMHGVPQFFKSLESTTFQLPPNLLFTDNEITVTMKKGTTGSGSDSDPDNVKVEYEVTESSSSEMTGMDWGNFNEDICGKWNDSQDSGLFYSIGCSTIKMKPKSCINMSRICEYGVSLDETKAIFNHDIKPSSENTPSDDSMYDTLIPDGFISKDELYNDDERSLFATLNINGLTTKRNPENGLREYVFKHVVVDNFDASLREYMSERQRKCNKTQKFNYLLEEFSQGYYDFRMGKNPYFYDKNGQFPRYENSFYFYFGLNAGKTAIDKFNSQFTSNCMNDGEDVSPISIDTKPNSWCVEMDLDGDYFDDDEYGYAAFDLSLIDLPCDIIIRSTTNSSLPEIVIKDYDKEKFYISKVEQAELENDGYVKYEIELPYDIDGSSSVDDSEFLTFLLNGTYELILTDSNGEIITTEFKISPSYIKSYIVGTDFYEPDNVIMPSHGNDRSEIIKDKECLPENPGEVSIDSTRSIGGTIAISWPYDEKSGESMSDFVITIDNDNMNYNVAVEVKYDVIVNNPIPGALLRYNKDVFIFGVPKGGEVYKVKIKQLCGDNESGNVYEEDVLIKELAPYKLYINGTVDYDVIKHWKSGFDVESVTIGENEKDGTAQINNEGTICDKWWHMSKPENYLWYNYIPYQDIDKELCELAKTYIDYVGRLDDFATEGIQTDVINNLKSLPSVISSIRNGSKNFLYSNPSPHGKDSDRLCGDSFTEINIASTIAELLDKKGTINDLTGVNDIGKQVILDFVDMLDEMIELLNEVEPLKNEFINNTKSAFQLNCSESQKSIFFTVDTKDRPVTFHGVYAPEAEDEDTKLFRIEDGYGDTKFYYTREGENIDLISIPTISHVESERFSDDSAGAKIVGNICYAKDNAGSKMHKYCNFIAVINSRGKTIPNDATVGPALHDDEPCGRSEWNFTDKKIKGNYFGYHIIDKIFENRFMMWSYFDRIPYYKPMKNDCFDESKAGASICMNGLFASKIFNGNATGYRTVYVYNGGQLMESDSAPTIFSGCYTKFYRNNGGKCDVISEDDYNNLTGVVEQGDYTPVYIPTSQPDKHISEAAYSALSGEEQTKYKESEETLFEEQRFSPYNMVIYTGRNDGESDADVEDKMPTVRYVVGADGGSNIDMPFKNYRVTSKTDEFNDEVWDLYQQQYVGVNRRSIDMNLSDQNGCMLTESLDGRMKIVLSDDSINLCSTDNDNHKKNSKFSVSVENPSGDNITYFVFSVDTVSNDEGEVKYRIPYPLNDAESASDCDDLLCRQSTFDMGWNNGTNENIEVFSKDKPKNLFSYYANPVYDGNTAFIGEAPTRKQLESKYIDPNTDKETTTKGYGNTGEFKMEKHDNPYFVVAISDNNSRAISPVYDFSYVCAKLVFGVIYSKQETMNEDGLVDGYEYVSSPKMTFDVANAIKKLNGCDHSDLGECVKEDDVLYYFYYYPYDIDFEIKLDDVSTVTGQYHHGAYKNNPEGYQLFDLDEHAFRTLYGIYLGSNNKVGKTIRGNTRIIAKDYSGLKHDVDWRGCIQDDFAKKRGCGHPYEFKEWVSVTWVTNGGKWAQVQSENAYVSSACDEWNTECGYYNSEANFTKLYTSGDSYKPYDVGELIKDNCDDESGFIGWSTSYDSSEVIPKDTVISILGNENESQIYYAVWSCDFVKVTWKDCDGNEIMTEDKVRIGTVLTDDDMPKSEAENMNFVGWYINYNEEETVHPEFDGNYTLTKNVEFTAICGASCKPSLRLINCADIGRDHINIVYMTMWIFENEQDAESGTPLKTISITWGPERMGSPDNPSLNNEDTYRHANAYDEGNVVRFEITAIELSNGCLIYPENQCIEQLQGDGGDECKREITEAFCQSVSVSQPDDIIIGRACAGSQTKAVITLDGVDCSCTVMHRVVWKWGYDRNGDGLDNDVIKVDYYVCEHDSVMHPQGITREGCTFNGWSLEGTDEIYDMWDAYPDVTSDLTFVAQWVCNDEPVVEPHSVTFVVGESTIATINVNDGDKVNLSDIPEDNNVYALVPEGKVWKDNRWQWWSVVNGNFAPMSISYTRNEIATEVTITADAKFVADLEDEVPVEYCNVTFKVGECQLGDVQSVEYNSYAQCPTSDTVQSSECFTEGFDVFEGEWRLDGTNQTYDETYINNSYKITTDTVFVAVLTRLGECEYDFYWSIPDELGNKDINGRDVTTESLAHGSIPSGTVPTPPDVTPPTLNGFNYGGWLIRGGDGTSFDNDNIPAIMIDTVFDGAWIDTGKRRYNISWRVENYSSKTLRAGHFTLKVNCPNGVVVDSGTDISFGGDIQPYPGSGEPNERHGTYFVADTMPSDWVSLYADKAVVTCQVGNDMVDVTWTRDSGLLVSNTYYRQNSGNSVLVVKLYDTAPSYPVTFNAVDTNGNLIKVIKSQNVDIATTLDDTIIPSESYICSYASPGGVGVAYRFVEWDDNPYGDEVWSALTYNAKLEKKQYNVTFMWDSDNPSNIIVKTVYHGDYAEEPDPSLAPVKEGYTFSGWNPVPSETRITSNNVVFIGVWATDNPDTVNVTFVVQEQNSDPVVSWSFEPLPVDVGHTLTQNEVPTEEQILAKTGNTDMYEFVGWENGASPAGTPIDTSVTFIAYVKKKQFVVTFNVKDSSDLNTALGQISQMTVDYGYVLSSDDLPTVQQILNATGNANAYDINTLFWRTGSTNVDFENGETYTITSRKTFSAILDMKSFTVTFNHNNGTGNKDVVYPFYDENINIISAPTYEGHTFNYWSCNLDSNHYNPGGTYNNVTSDIIFTAQWTQDAPNTHTVTFVFGHDIENVVMAVEDGNTVTPPTAPSVEGYLFDGWSGNPNVPITQDMTFTAIWKIRVIFKAEGSIIDTQYVSNNGHVTIPNVTVGDGRRFKDKWTIEGHTTQYTNDTVAGWAIQEPLVLVAVVVDVYTVGFYADTTKIGGTHTVESGNKITPPTNSAIDSAISGTGKVRYESDGGGWRIANSDGMFNTYNDVYSNDWFTNNSITSNMKLYARLAYKVIFDFNQDGYDNVEQYIEQGHHASVPSVPSVENCEFTGWNSSVSSLNTGDNITDNVTFTAQWECSEEPQKVKYNIPYCIVNGVGHEINTITVWVKAVTGSESKICETSMGGGIISGTHCRSDFYSDAFPENWNYITYEKCVADISTVGLVEIDTWNVSHSYKTDPTGTYKLYVDGVYYNPDTHPSQSSDASFNIHIDKIQ